MSSAAPARGSRHLDVLDGWRALSIVLVLCGHLLPLGPKAWRMNESIAATGMVLFFILSGFLIASFLLRQPEVRPFLVRRFCRVVPLAWLYIAVVLALNAAPPASWLAHLGFYANLPPFPIIDATAHLWSLCVEMQFYVGVALLVAVLGRRGLWLLPFVCLAVTAGRVASATPVSIVTWLRVDEILAGSTLALWFDRRAAAAPMRVVWPAYAVLAGLLVASANPLFETLNYARPYLAAAIVGLSLCDAGSSVVRLLQRRELAYLAKVSYAVYVLHGGLLATWLGSGGTLVKYLKRPLLLGVLFALAHLSTFHFEARWIALGHRWARRWGRTPPVGALP